MMIYKTLLKASLLSLCLLTLLENYALAKVYLGNDGFFYVDELEPRKSYQVDLGGMPFSKVAMSDACGVVQIRPRKSLQATEKVEIIDANKSFLFTNNNLNIKDGYNCKGQAESAGVWKDSQGKIFVSGLSKVKALTIRFLGDNSNRTIISNFCGFIRIKLENPTPKSIIVNGLAYPTNGISSGAIACRQNKLYIAYPAPQSVTPVAEQTWKEQNPLVPSTEAVPLNPSPTAAPAPTPTPAPATLPDPEPNFYLENGSLVIANRANGDILADLKMDDTDYVSLHVYNGSGQTKFACGRFKLNNSASIQGDYTVKKDITFRDFSITQNIYLNYKIPAGTVLKNFSTSYTTCPG